MPLHYPVLLDEVLRYLNVRSNLNYIDCTFGAGGHTEAILERNAPKGQVIALDMDPEAEARAALLKASHRKRLTLLHENFRSIGSVLSTAPAVAGVLYDLGFSTDFLKSGGRGLSFLQDEEPLDMRYDPSSSLTAAEILNYWKEKDIADCLFQNGEERYSRRIAKRAVEIRKKTPFVTVADLIDNVRASVPAAYRHGRIHCATRTFQALRIAVNDELGNLERSLESLPDRLAPGGRVVVITFHSLEDRIVKRFFKTLSLQKKGILLTKKPVIATDKEIQENPASRSAKLRAIEFIA